MRVNPLYTGRLFHCNIVDESSCHFRGVGSIFVAFVLVLMENPDNKQCKPLSVALFAYDSFTAFQVGMG